MNRTVLRRILVVTGILFLPSLFYLLLITGKNHFRTLEIYGPKEVNEQGDSLYHTIPAFSFINQEGKTITQDDVKDKIYVANFFFASCPTICPKMNENMRQVASKYKDDSFVQFLSFTVDPEHDSVPVLAQYAQERNAERYNWWFLTGDKEAIYTLAREGFLVPAAEGKTAEDFFHSQNLLLIDKENRIRGIYDGLEEDEMKKLKDEIKVLEMEYKKL